MDLNFDLNLVQSQKLLLTPKIRQVLEVLRMNSQELFEYVEEQLETNPVLEIVDSEEELADEDFEAAAEQEIWEGSSTGSEDTELKYEDKELVQETMDVDRHQIRLSLKDHLLFQLHTTNLDKNQLIIGEYIIDNIDENGYLKTELSEIAAYFNVPVDKITKVLRHLQTFDPPGICARNLKECLLIQMRQLENVDEETEEIVEKHLDELAARKFNDIVRDTGASIRKIEEVSKFIKTLEPKPGREFSSCDEIHYTIPDVIVKKIMDKYEVVINEDSVPLLNISRYYRRMVNDEANTEAKKFIQSKIDSASWLIKCIEQRKSTLRKISEYIVRTQPEFLEKGKNFVKPVSAAAVAQEVGIHETAAGRIICGKYIQCIWGIFEMRYFIKS